MCSLLQHNHSLKLAEALATKGDEKCKISKVISSATIKLPHLFLLQW